MLLRALATSLLLASVLPAQVRFERSPSKIDISIAGKPFTSLYLDGPKPYLHPLLAPSGTRITRLYPMESVAGETRDHVHHRGLWITYGEVNGLDFWANEKSSGGGTPGVMELKSIDELKGGPEGRLRFTYLWKTPGGQPLLEEHRTMVFEGDGERRIIDIDCSYKALQDIHFGDTKEGFLAIRMRDELNEKQGSGHLQNAEGKKGEPEIWGKATPWVDYTGTLNGETLGVAILSHPENPHYPGYWHARGYGLFAQNPIGEGAFLNDPSRAEGMHLKKGGTLRLRWKVVLHEGTPEKAGIGALAQTYQKKR